MWKLLIVIFILLVALRDILQKKHTISHNFPVIGHLRFILERFGPELRQYFFESNRDGKPFNRPERSWIYASAKGAKDIETGFGTDADLSNKNQFFIKPALIPGKTKDILFPKKNNERLVIGKNRRKPYFPKNIVHISGMSFGALSGNAVEALNRGAGLAESHQTTGEGGLSPYHLVSGKVILQFGTGYFGARTDDSTTENPKFDFGKLKALVDAHPQIVAIEFKISQGAKPLKASKFPAAKMTEEIRQIRGLKAGEDAYSPAYHSMFSTDEEMLDFIEKVAEWSGLPVGIKCAVGREDSWESLCQAIIKTGKCFDYIVFDAGDGGTGSAPESFTTYVGLPFQQGFSTMYKIFKAHNLTDKIVFIGSGKLGFPHKAALALAMGCDMINVGREALMSIGCVQSQHCHVGGSVINGGCPTGIATQDKWAQSGLDPYIKGRRCANYLLQLRKELIEITNAAGYSHPSELQTNDIMINSGDSKMLLSLKDIYGYTK